ncbi:hypothetical protein [Paenibacillus radicis (ex Xue et al. 2023)]|uniref:DUF4367 domain-containing protein n=1 Tax=Paenibacillus radicis (ex Xue et al. 2023) TaxID=2972489 RepID=A0ABT1YI14_9BACL|nr:hypothetical protein [Paenibacillus radicis (ex Xue et al. 2023)]MCR8632821.1 hypothetical protein [Paenibacillus radicis (ex Xue et al. 2023)]
MTTGGSKCPDEEINYGHALKLNDIHYTRDYESDLSNVKKGKKIGEVGFKLSGNSCSNYRMKNGDATLLPVSTAIYEVADYAQEYRVMANGELYEVTDNPKAKTIADLYDITGKVTKVSFESTGDGSHISDFSPEATNEFAVEYLKLKYIGFDEMYKKASGNNYFLRIYLTDGTSFRISYWSDHQAISPGAFGTDELKKIIQEQSQQR